MPTNIAIISGEASGDLIGAALARAIKARQPGVELWGVGSRRMAEAGVDLLYDSADWGAIGYVEVLKVYPRLRFKMYPGLIAEIDRRKPDLVVPIDFGVFNMKVARWCKPRGFKLLYYVPPGSWKRSGPVSADLAELADRIATPFPWSAERLASVGARAEFVGHPLLEIAKPTLTREQFCERF